MDPLSAIGLASAIVAFIDFSWNLVTGTWEIYHSLDGVAAENARLEDVTDDLESLTQALKADFSVKTQAEKSIQRLAQDCKEDARTLKSLLDELKAPGRRRLVWKSLNAKWKSILNKDEVARLKSQLQESRAEIQLNLIAMLREDQSAICLQITRIEKDCNDWKLDQPRQLKELQAALLEPLKECSQSIQQQLQDMQRLITTISMQHRILRHLIPDDQGSRREQIHEAHPDTYRWLLEPTTVDWHWREEVRDNLISWLRSGSNVLHISGNPGAGKSTLMKFISENPRTQKELRAWAGSRQLIFGQFYFWAAGTEAQRTLPGMLRALLFQVLSQCPELIKNVFSGQLEQMKTSRFQSDPSMEKFQNFGSTQIQKAFNIFLEDLDESGHRVCFLIDGLDEFQGDDLDHENLAARLNDWTSRENIKLLVSSRPWRPFVTAFKAHPTLHLHELNRRDIRTYAFRQLEQDREIRQIGLNLMRKTIEEIVTELVDHAQGIFLWAHLVLDTIRRDIRRQYSVDTLKAKLREYPSDLDGLYDALRGSIEKSPIDRKLSNRMLLLAATTPANFRLLAIAFSWLPEDDESGLLDPSFPPSIECQPYTDHDVAKRIECVADRIDGLTRGLLELVTVERWRPQPPEVRFCHRTARDYLITNVKRYAALEESWPHFHQSDPYGRIYLAELIYCRGPGSASISEYLNKPFCRSFSPDTIRKFETPMRPFLSPRWLSPTLRRLSGRLMWDRDDDQDTNPSGSVLFLRYAAYCRLDQSVLSEVARNSGTCPHSPGTNVLLASMYSALLQDHENFNLALSLLQSYMHKDSMIRTETQVKHLHSKNASISTLPVWVVALILGLKKILADFSQGLNGRQDKFCVRFDKAWVKHSLVKLCCLLDELGVKLRHGISVTVESEVTYFAEGGGGTTMQRVNAKGNFSAAQILQWAKNSGAGAVGLEGVEVMEDQNLQQYSGWVLDTVCTIREDHLPVSQKYRIASWTLDSPTRPMTEEYTDFNWRVFWNFITITGGHHTRGVHPTERYSRENCTRNDNPKRHFPRVNILGKTVLRDIIIVTIYPA